MVTVEQQMNIINQQQSAIDAARAQAEAAKVQQQQALSPQVTQQMIYARSASPQSAQTAMYGRQQQMLTTRNVVAQNLGAIGKYEGELSTEQARVDAARQETQDWRIAQDMVEKGVFYPGVSRSIANKYRALMAPGADIPNLDNDFIVSSPIIQQFSGGNIQMPVSSTSAFIPTNFNEGAAAVKAFQQGKLLTGPIANIRSPSDYNKEINDLYLTKLKETKIDLGIPKITDNQFNNMNYAGGYSSSGITLNPLYPIMETLFRGPVVAYQNTRNTLAHEIGHEIDFARPTAYTEFENIKGTTNT